MPLWLPQFPSTQPPRHQHLGVKPGAPLSASRPSNFKPRKWQGFELMGDLSKGSVGPFAWESLGSSLGKERRMEESGFSHRAETQRNDSMPCKSLPQITSPGHPLPKNKQALVPAILGPTFDKRRFRSRGCPQVCVPKAPSGHAVCHLGGNGHGLAVLSLQWVQ